MGSPKRPHIRHIRGKDVFAGRGNHKDKTKQEEFSQKLVKSESENLSLQDVQIELKKSLELAIDITNKSKRNMGIYIEIEDQIIEQFRQGMEDAKESVFGVYLEKNIFNNKELICLNSQIFNEPGLAPHIIFHELAHSTAIPSRLNRKVHYSNPKSDKKEDERLNAKEELIAEMTALNLSNYFKNRLTSEMKTQRNEFVSLCKSYLSTDDVQDAYSKSIEVFDYLVSVLKK